MSFPHRRPALMLALLCSLVIAAPAADESPETAALRAKAERGNSIAQYNLGLAYVATRDLPEAYVWLTLAEENGTTGKARRTLLDEMSPAQLAEGKRRLETRRAQTPAATPRITLPATADAASPIEAAPLPPADDAELRKVQAQLQTAITDGRALAALNKQLEDTAAQRGRLVEQTRAEAAALTAQVAQLNSAKAALEQQLAAAKNTAGAAASDSAALAALQADKKQLGAEVASAWQETEKLKSDLAAANAARAAADKSLAESAAELASLRAAAAKLSAEDYNRLQQQLKEALDSGRALAAKNQELEEIAARRGQALTEAQETLNQTHRQMTELAAAQSRLQAELASESANDRSLTQANSDLAAAERSGREAAGLAAQVSQLQSEKTSLEQQLAAAKNTASTVDAAGTALAAAQAAAAAANEKLTQAAAREAELNRRLTATAQALAAAQAAPARTADDPALASTREQLAQAGSRLSTVLNSYSSLERENEQLKASLAAAEQNARELDGERATLRQQLTELSTRPAPAATDAAPAVDPNQLADVEAKLATALRSYTLLQNENDQLKAAAEKAGADKASTDAQLGEANSRAAGLNEQLTTANAAAAQAEILRTQLRQTQDQLNALTAENGQLRTRLAISSSPPGSVLAAPTRPGAAVVFTPPAAPAAPEPAAPAERTHTVVAGDTLSKIARQYYGNGQRWAEILDANRDQLADERSLSLGMKLRIP